MAELSLPEKVVAIDKQLKDAQIPHAFGGALALAYYAEPRVTIDIDLNVFVSTTRVDEVNEALAPLGVPRVESEEDRFALERDGQCRIWWGETALDLFFSYYELHKAMRDSARRVPFGEDEIDVLGPEHLVICKACFDRPKDWLDIEQVLVASEDFDIEETNRWLKQMLGDDDPKKQRFDALVAELRD
jgi:hypothetical protein